VDRIVDVAAVIGSIGSITALVSIVLLRRQRQAETKLAEHDAVEAERDSEFEWYEKWRGCVKDREDADLAHDQAIKALQTRIALEETKWKSALADETRRRQQLEKRVLRLEAQVRSLGHDPVNGG